MIRHCLAAVACALVLSGAQAQGAAARTDASAAARYYDALLAAPAPDLAELGLLMNMLPKGGDLHHHYSGAIYAETYIDWVKQAGYCVYVESNAELKAGKFRIETRPRVDLSEAARAICMEADSLLEPRNDGFYRELLMRWSDKDYDNHSHAQRPPDAQFFDTFGYFGPVSGSLYNRGLRQLKARAQAENLQYMETMLRSAPARRAMFAAPAGEALNVLSPETAAAQVDATLAHLYDALANDAGTRAEVADYLKTLDEAAAGIDDDTFTLRFQAYVSRNSPPAQVFAGLYGAFAAAALSAAQPEGKLVAVNIVGPENWNVAMRDYRLHMRMFRFLKQKFPGVNLALHAGELALGMVPPEGLQGHIRDAIETGGAQRIGHGVDIAHERDAAGLLRLMRERRIAVEISLTSNAFILGIKGAAHPLQIYRRHGVPFVIATDDPGVSRNDLSSEYLLYASRYRPNYEQLKQTVYNGIRYAFLSDAQKARQLRRLDARFRDFEARVRELARPAGPVRQ